MRALEAYQRAAIVIDLADDSCHLDWPLLAALAKVESDHGRYAGATINSDGRVRPLILGPRLTGSDHTRRMPDTDAGRLDGDRRVDRALGPFQIVPATWAQVQVDADLDGRRDPNDVDDAALAAAVFLCSGPGDLATSDGQRVAVRRYNPDGGFARLVMDVMTGYEQTAGESRGPGSRHGRTGGGVRVDTDTPTRAHRQRCLLRRPGLAVLERGHDRRLDAGVSSTACPLTVPGCVPLLWMLRRRRHPGSRGGLISTAWSARPRGRA